jgi:hypothetical protein
MARRVTVIGAPSGAGACRVGQEQAPQAIRAAGLIEELVSAGFEVNDLGDSALVPWRPDGRDGRRGAGRRVRAEGRHRGGRPQPVCVAAGLVRRATSKAVYQVLASALSRYGIPDEILTDNGKCFTGRFGPHPVDVLIDRILRENGISHRHTGVRSPTTTGKIERFHRSLRKELLADRSFASLEVVQAELDAWSPTTTPTARTRPFRWPRRLSGSSDASGQGLHLDPRRSGRRPGRAVVLRRVASNGYVSVDNQPFSVGNAYRAKLVDVFVDETTSRSGAGTT